MTEKIFSIPQFDSSNAPHLPLSERMRPRTLEEIVGQEKLLGKGQILYRLIKNNDVPPMILWGPPGIGKTTIANVISRTCEARFIALSAVYSGIKEVKKVFSEAEHQLRVFSRSTILFVDEIHRFNKAQQDAFLPHVEKGSFTLIGATTENPSFEVISPLLSRSRIVVLEPLNEANLVKLLRRAITDVKRGLGNLSISFDDESLYLIANHSNGDARIALNTLELSVNLIKHQKCPKLKPNTIKEALQKRLLRVDKDGEEHFNLISALHKSLRNSDPDAALYWLARMLEAGEDPLYVGRRMVRFASEDIGLADPGALGRAIDGVRALQFIGLPEGKLILAQIAIGLALAPKSNSVYQAYTKVLNDLDSTHKDPVPLHLRNATTDLMKDIGYGKKYEYVHDVPEALIKMPCLPDRLSGKVYYEPKNKGHEARIKEKLDQIRRARKQFNRGKHKTI